MSKRTPRSKFPRNPSVAEANAEVRRLRAELRAAERKLAKAPKVPKVPRAPRVPKVPRAPRVPKVPKVPRARPPKPRPRKVAPGKPPAKPRKPPSGDSPPEGFVEFLGQAEAAERIGERLEDTHEVLASRTGIGGRLKVHRYRDGTVDGELVVDVPRGVRAVELTKRLEEAFGEQPSRDLWFQVGARFSVGSGDGREASGILDRRRGLDEVGVYYRRMAGSTGRPRTWVFGDAFARVEHKVIPAMEGKYGRKAESVFVRIHWNPQREKPRR